MTMMGGWETALTAAVWLFAVVGSASAQWQKTMVARDSKPSRQQCQQIMQNTAALKRLGGNADVWRFSPGDSPLAAAMRRYESARIQSVGPNGGLVAARKVLNRELDRCAN